MSGRRLLSSAFLLAMLGVATAADAAPVYNVTAAGAASTALGASADTLTLATGSVSVGLGTSFTLQGGSYNVGDSGQLQGAFNQTITELLTLGGQTVSLAVQLVNNVTLAADWLIVTGGSAYFSQSGVTLTVTPYTTPSYGVLGSQNFALQATLSQGNTQSAPLGVPEPAGLLMVGSGVIGLVWITRRRDERHARMETIAERRRSTGTGAVSSGPVPDMSLRLLGR